MHTQNRWNSGHLIEQAKTWLTTLNFSIYLQALIAASKPLLAACVSLFLFCTPPLLDGCDLSHLTKKYTLLQMLSKTAAEHCELNLNQEISIVTYQLEDTVYLPFKCSISFLLSAYFSFHSTTFFCPSTSFLLISRYWSSSFFSLLIISVIWADALTSSLSLIW